MASLNSDDGLWRGDGEEDGGNDDSNARVLLPDLRRAFPAASSYKNLATIVQSNAVGYKLDVLLDRKNDEEQDDEARRRNVPVFLKQVVASEYVTSKKDWADLRRTLLYARTEARFYSQILPLLRTRGFDATPRVYLADYDLEGWIGEDEVATAPADPAVNTDLLPDADRKGGLLVLECVSEGTHFQDSPLTVAQSKLCLEAVAELHAAAWQDVALLRAAEAQLSKASFHLRMRNPKELAGIVDSWEDFCNAFERHMDGAGLRTPSILQLGTRAQRLAEYVSEQVSPSPTDRYTTIIHGDYKSMNVFLPKQTSSGDANGDNVSRALLVDFASCGIGLGMSDLAMHIRHAVIPEDLENGGEEVVVRHYWEHLTALIDDDNADLYPWDVAWRHYKLAVVDYFRFFLARMWKSATPESMERKADNKNVSLINRNIPAAMAFLRAVDGYLTEVESELDRFHRVAGQ